MAVTSTAWYLALSLLGLTINPNSSPSTEKGNFATSCGNDEVHTQCEAHCQKNCTNWDRPLICPHRCLSGCVCKPGLVRDDRGVCVSPHECRANTPGVVKASKPSCESACNALCFLQTVAMRGRCTGGKCKCW
ncbi:hypothetical protein AVEN_217374-1 [Araneus ventricosus]|uniref:TIL domain-containing protein n=1 Tax=Araneus ventricosus TaxID=182803 RepID=A0A4Y2HX04_ARAVE|nr:hypothetical protein AVEN_217374-1 [Araneus ventricosus]